MLSTRNPPQNKRHIQTKSEGLGKKYFMQMETKRKQESQYSYHFWAYTPRKPDLKETRALGSSPPVAKPLPHISCIGRQVLYH